MKARYEWDEFDMAATKEGSAIRHKRSMTPKRTIPSRMETRRLGMVRGVIGANQRKAKGLIAVGN